MRPTSEPTRGIRIAVAALIASVGVGAYATWQALVLDPVPVLPAASDRPDFLDRQGPAPSVPVDDVLVAVTVDPFHPDRQAPERRYRVEADAPIEVIPDASLRLTGTALLPGGSAFVLAALGTESPSIMRLGESLGRYLLVAVREGEADFQVGSENVTLSVLRPGS